MVFMNKEVKIQQEGEKKVYCPKIEVLEARIAPMSAQGAAHISAQGAAHNHDPARNGDG